MSDANRIPTVVNRMQQQPNQTRRFAAGRYVSMGLPQLGTGGERSLWLGTELFDDVVYPRAMV